jgi:hypothetical protein
MQFIRTAALTAGLCLAAGAADAATWSYSGTGVTEGSFTGFEQGTTYFVQYVSDQHWQYAGLDVAYNKARVWLDGTEIDAYNLYVPVTPVAQSWGFTAQFTVNMDTTGDFHLTYDPAKFRWIADPLANREPPLPWSLTFSTDPITAPGAVPEPAVWAMMLVGFGLAGGGLRRQRQAARFQP